MLCSVLSHLLRWLSHHTAWEHRTQDERDAALAALTIFELE